MLTSCGNSCIVVAPSPIPMKSGDRVETDRRDATILAKLHRAREPTAIWIPDAVHEARPGAGTRGGPLVLAKARQHLQGLLLHHTGFAGGGAWTTAYRRRLATARFEHPARPIVLPPGCAAEMAVLARRRRFRSRSGWSEPIGEFTTKWQWARERHRDDRAARSRGLDILGLRARHSRFICQRRSFADRDARGFGKDTGAARP